MMAEGKSRIKLVRAIVARFAIAASVYVAFLSLIASGTLREYCRVFDEGYAPVPFLARVTATPVPAMLLFGLIAIAVLKECFVKDDFWRIIANIVLLGIAVLWIGLVVVAFAMVGDELFSEM